jgi:hypothetical protein
VVSRCRFFAFVLLLLSASSSKSLHRRFSPPTQAVQFYSTITDRQARVLYRAQERSGACDRNRDAWLRRRAQERSHASSKRSRSAASPIPPRHLLRQPAGHVGLPEQTEGRRIGWGGCTYSQRQVWLGSRDSRHLLCRRHEREEDHALLRLRRSSHAADHQHLRRRRRPSAARHQALS